MVVVETSPRRRGHFLFDNLGDRLQGVFRKLKGRGRLSEKDVEMALREIRLALLDADVNFKTVKEFLARVKERAVGEEVFKSITPAQQMVKIVHDEMAFILGEAQEGINFSPKPPTVVMMVGLQGSGKTTACAKLARFLKSKGRSPLLVAVDIYRPAAIDQLEILGEQIEVPVFVRRSQDPLDIVKGALKEAKGLGSDLLILDTAGRLHIDEEMMQELVDVKEICEPSEILLVADAMTGQDAVNMAQSFMEKLEIDGLILTKLDGDARGGAALSMKSVTGRPIKFASVGEKMEDLEVFYPDRMASRILGMGDVVTLVEKAEETITEERAKKLEEKLRKQKLDFNDFLEQIKQMQSMGGITKVLSMVPGMGSTAKMAQMGLDERQLVRVEAIIQSMTDKERKNPQMLNASRRRRIARGSGTSTQKVNQLVKQFSQMQKLMKQLAGAGPGSGMLKKLFPFG